MYDVIPIVVSFVSGSIAGAIVSHVLAGRRDRGNVKSSRKEKFLSFMRKWESEADAGKCIFHVVANHFVSKRHDLISAASEMELSYSGRRKERFVQLVTAIRNMSPAEIDETRYHGTGQLIGVKALLDAIRAVIAFVERN